MSIMILCAGSAFSAITNRDMTNATYLKNQNYSDETVRLIKMQDYTPDQDKDKNSDVKKPNPWRTFNSYIDPAYDNGQFGRKNINFSNRADDN